MAIWFKYLHFSSNPSHKEKHPEELGISYNFTMLFVGWSFSMSLPKEKVNF